MADPYAYDTYAGREGETFSIVLDDDHRVDAMLKSVTAHPARGFSVVFVAPGDVLPQATYTLLHAELGTCELFIVPIGRDERGVSYEAVFN